MTPYRAASAVIDATAKVPADCAIGENVVIGAGALLGARCAIGANTVIGAGVEIGDDCCIAANVTLSHCLIGSRVVVHPGARIGQPGFGFAPDAGGATSRFRRSAASSSPTMSISAPTPRSIAARGPTP